MKGKHFTVDIEEPDLKGLIDEDILKRFEKASVFYGDIINAQLIKTIRELTEALNEHKR